MGLPILRRAFLSSLLGGTASAALADTRFLGVPPNGGFGFMANGTGGPFSGSSPSWLLVADGTQQAIVDLDFASNRGFQSGSVAAPASFLTVSRTTTGSVGSYADDLSGNWIKFADNVARITNRGLLVEESRSNEFTFSSDLTKSIWTGQNATIANPIIAPDNTQSAYKIVDSNTTNAQHLFFVTTVASAFTAGATVTYSGFFKPADYQSIIVAVKDFATFINGFEAQFTLTGAGSVSNTFSFGTGTFTSASIIAYANGWYRIALTGIVDAADTQAKAAIFLNAGASYSGVPGNGLYHWNSQLEVGAFATSPIVTTGSALTRSADAISLTTVPTPTTYNPMAMVFRGQIIPTSISTIPVFGGWAAATGFNDTTYISGPSSGVAFNEIIGGSGFTVVGGSMTPQFRLAASAATNSNNIAVNGTAATRDIVHSPTAQPITAVIIGSAPWSPGSNIVNAYFQRFALFRTSVSDAGLQTLTA